MRTRKILLVDDEPSLIEVIGERIKLWGYDMISAGDGRGGLRLFISDRPDIIVLDYMMPDIDGIETLREIRKIDADIPVIIFTAYPDEVSMKASDGLGVAAYVPKLSTATEGQTGLRVALEMICRRLDGRT